MPPTDATPDATPPPYHDGAYAPVSFRPNLGVLSLLFATFPFLLGILLDELPFMGSRWVRQHLGELVLAALSSAALGAVFGAVALRRPQTRIIGRFGLAINLIILLLLSLFVLAFRYILGR